MKKSCWNSIYEHSFTDVENRSKTLRYGKAFVDKLLVYCNWNKEFFADSFWLFYLIIVIIVKIRETLFLSLITKPKERITYFFIVLTKCLRIFTSEYKFCLFTRGKIAIYLPICFLFHPNCPVFSRIVSSRSSLSQWML